MKDAPQSCRFGPFTLETGRGVLLGPEGEIRLRPKSFDVLHYLVRHPGRLVSRGELIDAVWGRTAITDDSLTQCMVEIRRALGDSARQLVRTVPRRGYVFDPPVDAPAIVTRRRSFAAMAVFATVLLAAALASWVYRAHEPAGPGAGTPRRPVPNSIAVLPFADMSAARDQPHLGEGIAEEILNSLARASGLAVIARTSSFSFGANPGDIRDIAAQLGVAYVLEGSVRTSGNRVRIVAQLIDAASGTHLWSEVFDREFGDIFAVQSEIAETVATVLSSSTGPLAAVRTPADVTAWEHFMRGRFLFHRRGEGDLERARQHFTVAVERDPGYAAAWAALAGTYMAQHTEDRDTAKELEEAARRAVDRALALDPESVEGHVRAAMLAIREGDEPRAMQHMETAESLEPENPLLLGVLGSFALSNCDRATAIDLWRRARERDPLSALYRRNLGVLLLAERRIDEARVEFFALREMNPDRPSHLEQDLADQLIAEQRYEEAVDVLAALPESDLRDRSLAIAAHALGREAETREAIERLRARTTSSAAHVLAAVHAQRGELEDAWQWLEVSRQRFAAETDAPLRLWRSLACETWYFQPLESDPRWATLFAGTHSRSPGGDGRETR